MSNAPQPPLAELIALHGVAQQYGLHDAAAWLRTHLDTMTAPRDESKLLTPVQRVLLEELKGEEPGCWLEIFRGELRTARSLERRGLIEMNGDYEARYKWERA